MHLPIMTTGRRAAVLCLAAAAATCGATVPALATTAPATAHMTTPISTPMTTPTSTSIQHLRTTASAVRPAGAYQGEVTSPSGLTIRFGPTTASQAVGALPYKAVISIQCKVVGQTVDGNSLWYKIANTTGEWVTARYVANIGPAPSYC